MIKFCLLFAIAFTVANCQQYVAQPYVGAYPGVAAQYEHQHSNSEASASAYASSQNSQYSSLSNALPGQIAAAPAYGAAVHQNLQYTAVDPKAQTTYASEAYHANKGEILIHRPAPIIVKRPPTKVLVNHPPLVVRPAPVVLHKPPPVILRKVYVKQHPRPVKVEPVYVNVVKPPAEKYFVNEKAAHSAAAYHQHYQPQLAQVQQIQQLQQIQSQSQSQSQSQAQAQAQSQSQSQSQTQSQAQF